MEPLEMHQRFAKYTQGQLDVVRAVVMATSALSILGCCAIFYSYAAFPSIRATSRRLLVYLSVCDVLVAALYLVSASVNNDQLVSSDGHATALCLVQSAITSAGSIGSFLWTTAIATFLYVSIARGNPGLAERSVLGFHVVCWAIPLAVVAVAWRYNVLGFDSDITGGWCWLSRRRTERGALFWEMFAGKAWELASYVVTPLLYVLIKLKMSREVHIVPEEQHLLGRQARRAAQAVDRKLVFVPLVFVLLRVWGTARCLLQLTGYEHRDLFPLVLLQAFGDCGQGFANGVLFCVMTPSVRSGFLACLCRPFAGPPPHQGRHQTLNSGA